MGEKFENFFIIFDILIAFIFILTMEYCHEMVSLGVFFLILLVNALLIANNGRNRNKDK